MIPASIEVERFITRLRKELLNLIIQRGNVPEHLKPLTESLAAQCFLNEYIYDQSKDEIEKIKKIDERIKKNLKENIKISDLDILCLSCYEPLTNFSWSNKVKFFNTRKRINT